MNNDISSYQEDKYSKNKFIQNILSFKTLTTLALISILINLIYVEASSYINSQPKVIETITKIIPFSSSQSNNKIADGVCPQACIATIYEATASGKAEQTAQPTPAQEVSPTITLEPVTEGKEFFIPFGSGSSSAGDWQDVPGVLANINTDNYPQLKTATFEVTLRIPTGNQTAYVRLYNTTDKHPIWDSEVSLEGGTTQLLTKSITLGLGNKVYQVQMRTSLKFQAIFDQARLHMITY